VTADECGVVILWGMKEEPILLHRLNESKIPVLWVQLGFAAQICVTSSVDGNINI